MTFLQKCALSPQAGHLHIYWLGQAGFLIRNSSGKNLLIDAYLSDYVEKCDGSKRLMMAVAEPQDLRPDVILASHDHADHLDMDSLPLLLSHGAPLFCSGESYRRCAQAGFPMQQITAMKPGDRASAAGYSIEAVFADHGDYAPDAVGFWIESEGVRLYFTGDTSYQPGRMAPVAQRHPDLLILPINGEWKGGVPFGWNSWAAHALDLDLDKAETAAAFLGTRLQPAGYGGAGGVSINLDAGWGRMSEAQLAAFAAHRHAVGQRAGIYDAPFAFFGRDADAPVPELPGHTYAELLLRGPDGCILPPVDGGRAYDVTSPLWREMTAAKLNRFVVLGFDYCKLDFLSHGGFEGCHADPAVSTGRQAIAQGYRFVCEQLSPQKAGRPIFLSLSIAPLFPAGFGHARRSSCDSFGLAGDVEYTLNAQTYAWWQSGRLYTYNDPDHISLYRSFPRPRASTLGEARARYTSAVIAGTVMMLSEDFADPEAAKRAETLACNRAVNHIAAAGTAFRPETSAGSSAAQIYRAEIDGAACIALFHWESGKAEISYNLPPNCRCRHWRELWSGADVKCSKGVLTWSANNCDAALFTEIR